MKIFISNKRRNVLNIQKSFPNFELIDVTSKGIMPWVKFSPFYPHGNIPVPFSKGHFSFSVEGIWQGLKVFENSNVDISKFQITTMKGIKRSVKKYGNVLGHQKGLGSNELLPYRVARYVIYIESYKWMLVNYLQNELQAIRNQAVRTGVVLLDYETNTDVENLKKPLSHASLIKRYIEDEWPAYVS